MIEIKFQYYSLFKLAVLHNYYAEQPSNDFKLEPTEDTLAIIKKLNLIFKEVNGEYFILYDPDKIDGFLGEVERKQNIKFTFLLNCSNPYFVNITEIPVEGRSEFFYFSNQHTNHIGENTYLHHSEFAGKADKVFVESNIEISGDGKKKLVELKDDAGNIILTKNIESEEKFYISNKNVPLGKYHLFVNGNFQRAFILFSNVPLKRPIGIVEFSFAGKIREEFIQGVKQNEIPFYNYKISFTSRSTFWKYFLVGKYNSNLKNTTIDSGDDKVKFKGPQEVKLHNGTDAIMFVCDGALPLKQIQEHRFQLKNVKAGVLNGKTIMDRLPLPSPEIIKPESKDENSIIFSEIIVNI
jgi:hypothetical protein